MNLDQKLEMARVRAEKEAGGFANDKEIRRQLKAEMKQLEEEYGKDFAQTKRTFDGLLPLEGYYDSYAEQMQRRDEYINECEAKIRRLQKLVDELESEDPLEKHLKSTAWNLNRIANVLEEQFALSDSQAILAQLRSKGGRRNG
jgi:chromosome segregation ATPase